MTIIVFNEKHGDTYFQSDNRNHVFEHVLRARIEDDYWYEGDDLEAAKYALSCGRAEQFLRGRRDYEYEGYEDVNITVL